MSPQFNFQENELEEADIITLWDEQGRSLDCYIENAYETDDLTYWDLNKFQAQTKPKLAL